MLSWLVTLSSLAWLGGCDARRPPEQPDATKTQSASSGGVTAQAAPGAVSTGETGSVPSSPAAASLPIADQAGGRAWLAAADLPYEFWEVQYLNAARVGVTHYKVEKLDANRLRLSSETTMQIQRAGQMVRQKIKVESFEQQDGSVESYFEEIAGDSTSATANVRGSVSDGVLRLAVARGGATTTKNVDWPSHAWGPLGLHQLLQRQPMTAGERRNAKIFLPQLHQIAEVSLIARNPEETPSPQGILSGVLPIDVSMQLEQDTIQSRIWVNARGQIQKTIMTAGLNISSYLVPRAVAEQMEAQGQIDLLAATSIKIEPPLIHADQAARIDYMVESSTKDPYSLLSHEGNQTTKSLSALRAQLTVVRSSLSLPPPEGSVQTPPGPECLAANAWMQVDAPVIIKLAEQLSAGQSEPSAVARQLTEGVYRAIRKKNFSRAFDSATEVAHSLEGDCTEHAILLATLLRQRRIPARLASGVVVNDATQATAFVYHMWTEAWLGQHWVALDATQGTPAGAGHIKFLETPLADGNPYAALLPVLSTLGSLKITLEAVK
jgi:hypothetical protein